MFLRLSFSQQNRIALFKTVSVTEKAVYINSQKVLSTVPDINAQSILAAINPHSFKIFNSTICHLRCLIPLLQPKPFQIL